MSGYKIHQYKLHLVTKFEMDVPNVALSCLLSVSSRLPMFSGLTDLTDRAHCVPGGPSAPPGASPAPGSAIVTAAPARRIQTGWTAAAHLQPKQSNRLTGGPVGGHPANDE